MMTQIAAMNKKRQPNGPKSFAKNQQQKPEKSLKRKQLLMKVGIKWHKHKVDNVPAKTKNTTITRDQITQLRAEASSLIKTDLFAYEEYKNSSSKREDFEWISTVLSNGTVSDKLAAHTVLIQDSTVHNLKSIDSLIRFVNVKGKRECSMAIDNLRDLFIGDLLIPKQKLKTFEDIVEKVDLDFLSDHQNTLRSQFLIITFVEDQIRSLYKRFLDQLAQVSHDTLDSLKLKAIRTLSDLFIQNPEQEKLILSSLVNKLGDPTPKVASQCAHLLSEIISKHHPQMKMIIVKEVERLLYRQHLTPRTQYYCLCFLSEVIFKASVDQALANHLIEIYFSIFNKCIKLGEVNNKTMSVLLTGVSRAFPYSKLENKFLEQYLQTFYKIIHFVNLNTGIQTLALIFNLVNFNESGSLTDRFYSVLYRFLFQPNLDQCSKANLLLNTLYRSVKKDPVHKRVRAFFKRILQMALQSSSAFVICALILISETLKTKEGFQLKVNSAVKEEASNKVVSTSNDIDKFDDDEIERYEDVDEENHTAKVVEQAKLETKPTGSWVYLEQNKSSEEKNKSSLYSSDVRNPLYCNAEFEEFWELSLLAEHYHPTVKLFTENILSGQSIEYDGDPLEDFTVKHFLDRFAFRNPKNTVSASKKEKNYNRFNVFGRLRTQTFAYLNSNNYLDLPEEEIPADERFIHSYLKHKDNQKAAIEEDNESDIESVTSVEFNDILDNYENYANDEEDLEDIDFAKNFKENSRKGKQPDQTADDDDLISDNEADFDEEFMDDENDENEDSSGLDEDDLVENDEDLDDGQMFGPKVKKPLNAAPFGGKKGFSNITNEIFASAEEFSHILEQNESDSDFDLEEETSSQKNAPTNSKKRKHRPSLGRNLKKKKQKRLAYKQLD